MSQVTLSCQCGTVLSIPGAKPGDQVRCVKCGRSSIVRNEEDPSTAQTRTEDWIKFTCTCGKSVKAPKSWAGEIAKCPRCKRKTRLPGGDHGRRDRNDPLAVFYDPKEADRDVLRLSQLGNQKPTNQSGETSILPSPVAPAPAAATPNSPTASIADELDAALSDGGASRNEGTMFMEAVTEHDQDPSSLAESTGTLDPILRATCACGKVVKAPLTGLYLRIVCFSHSVKYTSPFVPTAVPKQ